ncbi:hypothetical protein [Mycoplasmopsis pullorum]|uniref:Uncharacterized protein n=1 Tax=Mycoplasmopsis pullorum TaxID=48003 RepID=A0A1L4FT80_9BACT|nr:hypothetical protein [Mycoplasmopsis pullorum]APJ38094.1 hypothetical protein BLA55_00060 [Mycoplasmopsis pullorum]APJ38753.1 hypothetical protein BLA55_03775 [Mycoplasmopsis pullorum]APJ38794.1 hypothetical protein BLA55_04010 [Mycoplasmopsis pullorum]TNK81857.1 hypothetical protein C4M94_02785 [Mycoplasmopsis pullorum]TNK82582.1 hypothetical protein C4M80_02830 [Mycoplasmopsis pullorum]
MYKKLKINLSKIDFYFLISLLPFWTLSYIVWFLIPFVFGIKNAETYSEIELENYTRLLILSFIGSNLLVVFFLIYISLLRNKLQAGYIFFICWIIIFIILGFTPFFKGFDTLLLEQIISGVFVSLSAALIALYLIYMCFKYHIARKIHNFEAIRKRQTKG